MPTYLCHGFRWNRRDIRIFVILNDLEDAAPNWVIAPATSASILSQFYASYDFLPKPAPPTPPSERDVDSRRVKAEDQQEHIDDDHSLPPPRVPPSQDGVLMHSWSAVKVLEEFDPDETTVPCRPYAYVADHVVRVDLSVDVAGEMAKYYDKMARDDGWIVSLRDELQKGEPVRWYVVVCGDEVREVPCESDYGDSDEEEYDDDDDEVLTVLEDIAEEPAAGAWTPRPLDQEEPGVYRQLQPEDLVPQRSSTSTSSSSWPLSQGSPSVPPRLPTPDVDVPLLQPDEMISPRYSTSTTSWLYEDDGEPTGQHVMLKPEEFAKAQSPARSPIPEEPPDVVMPLRPEELAPPRSPSPMTPSAAQQELPGSSLHSPEESLPPPRSPSPMSPNPSQQEQLGSKFSYTPEESISLRSPSPMTTNPAQQDLLGSALHRQEEISPPRSPSPMSPAPLQQELLGSAPNRPVDIMPPRTPSPMSPAQPQPEQAVAARPPSPPTPPTPRQTQPVAPGISVPDSRDTISAPSPSPTTPTLPQKDTSGARLLTHSRDSLARSPSPMSPGHTPRGTPRLGVPPPPEPAETVVVVPPPTPPKPRPVQEDSLLPEPVEPLEAPGKIKAPPSAPMVHQGEAEDSGAELEGEVIPEPPPTPVSDYDWDAESEQSQSLEDEEGVRAPPPTRVQTRQASVSTQHSDIYKPDGHRQRRINRRQSVAEGLKRLFKRQH